MALHCSIVTLDSWRKHAVRISSSDLMSTDDNIKPPPKTAAVIPTVNIVFFTTIAPIIEKPKGLPYADANHHHNLIHDW
jgi:hypothetical protein